MLVVEEVGRGGEVGELQPLEGSLAPGRLGHLATALGSLEVGD